MKLLIPTLVLAAAAHAQTAPVVPAAKAGETGRISLGYVDAGDADGYRLAVSAGIAQHCFIEASFADASGLTAATDYRSYSFAAGYRWAFGAGKASVALGLGSLDSDTAALNGEQYSARLGYTVEIAKGLEAEISLTHTFNSLDDTTVADLTAPTLTLRYVVANGLGIEASASSKDTLSHTDTDHGSWSLAATYSF